MTLPLITNLLMHGRTGERALGQVYGVNTLGSIFGVALAALVLLPALGLKWMIVVGASIDVGLGVWLLVLHERPRFERRDLRLWWPALATVALVIVVGGSTRFNRGVLTSGVFRSGHAKAPTIPDLVYFADGRTATVSVRQVPRSKAIFLATNGKTDASLGAEWFVPPAVATPFTHDASTQLLLPLVTLAHAPHARRAAVIGQGSGMSSHTLLGDAALERVVTIEIEPEMLRASRSFYPANRRVFDDPRSVFALDDARSYFASQGERFDLILSEPSNPWVAGVSGLFTSEFYAHVRRYLTPDGVFGQWLHLSELNDGLALSVVRAVAENFPDYALYAVSNRDVLIVATNREALPAPDWSVFALPEVASELRRVVALTPPMLNALRMTDAATLAPLVHDGGGANSDFYPTLDLGAERARYLDEDAAGFVWMAGERFGLSSLTATTRAGVDGKPYTAIIGVPRLEAMELASRVRHGEFAGAGGLQLGASERARAVDRLLASDVVPVDWHVWVGVLRDADETRSGGSAGVADTALYAAAGRALVRGRAPVEARAAVAFLHGLAAWDFAESARAAEPLLAAARRNDHWLPPDLLLDGAVVARLRMNDVRGARAALDALTSVSSRARNDVRAQLLAAWVRAAESPTRPTPVASR
jgi:spermidine synthase